jgi:hypothetical protein
MILSIIIAHPTVGVGHMYGMHDRWYSPTLTAQKKKKKKILTGST